MRGGVGAVARFAVVAFGHPDGLDSVAGSAGAGYRYKIAFGSVDGAKGVDDFGKADGISGLSELLAELFGEGCQLVKAGDPMAVKGCGKLPPAVGGD